MALAIFSAVTLYTIFDMNDVMVDEGVNVLADLPSDIEEAATRTSGEEYMATA